MAESNHLSDKELRLEILRLVKECGSEFQKKIPCQSLTNIITGLIGVGQFVRTPLARRNRLLV